VKLEFVPYSLQLKHPFGVSSNTRTHTPAVFTRIEHEGRVGYGEACLPAYLGETTKDTLLFLERAKHIIQQTASPFPESDLMKKVNALSEKNSAGKAAVDIALMDLQGKLMNKPFYDMKGFGKSPPVVTSCTIGIDQDAILAQKIQEASEFSILKIKAGTANDKALISLIRNYTGQPLYVDVNQGWTDKYFVLEMLHWMKEKNVLLVEQPMPVNMRDDMAWVTERSPLPTIADESVKGLSDLDQVTGVFSGINIKLMKCGGLTEAIKMIRYARQNHLQVMLGCMAESSCATSAMAQLAKFGDYIDLDAPNLISNDPFDGIKYEEGKIVLNGRPGTGVQLKEEFTVFK
jgi:L-Ala-D/L-Glu epimerase